MHFDLDRKRLILGGDACFLIGKFGCHLSMQLSGREHLHMQGLQYEPLTLSSFSERQLSDLAGNARLVSPKTILS